MTARWLLVVVAACGGTTVVAHSGPPFPIVSDRTVGPYVISIWTDPDATNDGSAAGQFWIVMRSVPEGATLADARVEVTVAPSDREGIQQQGVAEPVDGDLARRFVALKMDHEGPFSVEVSVSGPRGGGPVRSDVNATYDTRPSPMMLAVYLMPFLLVGALWLKLLLSRVRRAAP